MDSYKLSHQSLKLKILELNNLEIDQIFEQNPEMSEDVWNAEQKFADESIIFAVLQKKNSGTLEKLEIIKSLMDNIPYETMNIFFNRDGLSILAYLCYTMESDILQYFFDEHDSLFNPNLMMEDYNTALHVAVLYEAGDSPNPCLDILFQNRIDVNIGEGEEGTALHLAIKECCVHNARYLLSRSGRVYDFRKLDVQKNTIFHDLIFMRVVELWEPAIRNLYDNYDFNYIQKVMNQVNFQGHKLTHEAAMLSHVEPYFWDYIQKNHEKLFLKIDEPSANGETIEQIIEFYRDSVALGPPKGSAQLQRAETEERTENEESDEDEEWKSLRKTEKQKNKIVQEMQDDPFQVIQVPQNIRELMQDETKDQLIHRKRTMEYPNYQESIEKELKKISQNVDDKDSIEKDKKKNQGVQYLETSRFTLKTEQLIILGLLVLVYYMFT